MDKYGVLAGQKISPNLKTHEDTHEKNNATIAKVVSGVKQNNRDG